MILICVPFGGVLGVHQAFPGCSRSEFVDVWVRLLRNKDPNDGLACTPGTSLWDLQTPTGDNSARRISSPANVDITHSRAPGLKSAPCKFAQVPETNAFGRIYSQPSNLEG